MAVLEVYQDTLIKINSPCSVAAYRYKVGREILRVVVVKVQYRFCTIKAVFG